MKRLDKTSVTKYAQDLMLELNATEIDRVLEEAATFHAHIDMLQKFDTKGIDMMSYPFEEETTWLREDTPNHVIEQALAFENAPRVSDDYFEVVKVVNK